MDVSAYGTTQQLQMQMQGSGNGQGQGGMKDIMQSLSTEDRATMKEKLSSMSQEDRASMVSQMKEVDAASMSSQDYTQTLLDMLNQESTNKKSTSSSAAFGFSTYA
jgi:hypothetical protein